MNDVRSRAAAIRELLESGHSEAASQPVAEATLSCCNELIEAGEPGAAIELAESCSKVSSYSDGTWRLRLRIVHARATLMAGEFIAALDAIDELLRGDVEVLKFRGEDVVLLRILRGSCLWGLNRVDESVDELLVVRSELLVRPDSALLSLCNYQLASAETIRGKYSEARRYALEAIVSARRSSHKTHEIMALMSLSLLERFACRWASAADAADEALRTSQQIGGGLNECHALRSLAIISWKRGYLVRARETTTRHNNKAASLNSPRWQWFGSLLEGMILLHAGEYEEANRLFSLGTKWDIPEARTRPSLLTTEFLGDIHLEQGQAEPALQLYDEVWPKALALVPKGDIVAELRRRRAECHLLLGRHQEAYDEARTGLDHCRELGDRYEEAATYRVLALSTAALGNADEAKRFFEQGFAYYDDIETPYEWGKLWLAYGDWLRGEAAGHYTDLKGALEAYQAACDHFDRMGAAAKLADANARIAALVPLLPKAAIPAPASAEDDAAEPRRPQRRPRGSTELEQRSQWAQETFGLITRNKHMLNLLEDVRKLARSKAPILVLGESGTGKELVARGLHRLSERPDRFIPINCGALPREIIESELFGYIAGAFTGANKDKPGLFEECGEGTIFLDEIGEMSVELQSRLLRVLESGEIRRVGSSSNVSVKARVLAATNRDRGALQRGESFRQDLYYRLAHAVIVLTPLRKRVEDIELLVDHFLQEISEEEAKPVTISADARLRMQRYAWPGNVRQLRATIRRSVLLASPGHEVTGNDLELDDGTVPTTLLEELEQAEKRRILEALRHARGAKAEAAKMLGMPRTTLLHKLKRFGIG